MPVACCSWRRPIRSAIRRWCGARRSDSEFRSRLRDTVESEDLLALSPAGGVPSSAGSLGRLPGRPAERAARGPPRARGGDRSGSSTRIGAPGTARRPQPTPDEEVARELERSAGRAQARGGLAAAAAFLERSIALTVDPARRVDRALAAARANLYAGAFDEALRLLPVAEAGSPDELQQAQAELLRGQIAFSANIGSDAPPLLLSAARRLERFDVDLARETYLDAWGAAWFAGSLATAGDLLEVSRAARSAPPSTHPSQPFDLLLDGLALLITEGRAAAASALRRASNAFAAAEIPAENSFRWIALPPIPSYVLWDDESWYAINARQLGLAREAGALARLPMGLDHRRGH